MTIRTRITIGSLIVLALLAMGIAYTNQTTSAPLEVPRESINVTLAIEGVLPIHAAIVEKGTTALELLREESAEEDFILSEKKYAGLGSMVERIGPLENGKGGKYWTYTVNGEFAAVGADMYEMQPGDAIEWTFAVPEDY